MVPLPFEMWVGEHDGVLTARLAGRLEAPWAAAEVHRELQRHFSATLRLDLSGVTAIDPPGLAAVAALRQDVVSGGGRFVLHGVTGAVRTTFEAAGLDALVDDDRPEAAGPVVVPVTPLPVKGGRDARRPAAAAPKVA